MNERDQVVISPGVLIATAAFSALQVDGVARMAPIPVDAQKLFANNIMSNGIVMVQNADNSITLDLYLILKPEHVMIDTAKQVQEVVQRSLFDVVGVDKATVNIHIEDVASPESLHVSQDSTQAPHAN